MKRNTKKSGFTLVELAIVLVIIGLIIGGVLTGQDLIKAAENNAAISQFEKIDSAVNTFRTKYNGLPGDLTSAGNYGLAATNTATTGGLGDNDGIVEAGSCSNANGLGGESALFWTHLSQSGLLAGNTAAITDYTAVAAIAAIGDTQLPPSKFGKGNRLHVTNVVGRNVYALSNYSASAITTCLLTSAHAISPLQASNLDIKKDDGVATTGLVVSILGGAPASVAGGSSTPDNGTTGATDDCYDTDTNAYATTTNDLASALACSLRIRSSF